jgi:hypothetical protein
VVREMNAQFVENTFRLQSVRALAEDLVQSATNELHDKLTTFFSTTSFQFFFSFSLISTYEFKNQKVLILKFCFHFFYKGEEKWYY